MKLPAFLWKKKQLWNRLGVYQESAQQIGNYMYWNESQSLP